jgi:hypothetical protein
LLFRELIEVFLFFFFGSFRHFSLRLKLVEVALDVIGISVRDPITVCVLIELAM